MEGLQKPNDFNNCINLCYGLVFTSDWISIKNSGDQNENWNELKQNKLPDNCVHGSLDFAEGPKAFFSLCNQLEVQQSVGL